MEKEKISHFHSSDDDDKTRSNSNKSLLLFPHFIYDTSSFPFFLRKTEYNKYLGSFFSLCWTN